MNGSWLEWDINPKVDACDSSILLWEEEAGSVVVFFWIYLLTSIWRVLLSIKGPLTYWILLPSLILRWVWKGFLWLLSWTTCIEQEKPYSVLFMNTSNWCALITLMCKLSRWWNVPYSKFFLLSKRNITF